MTTHDEKILELLDRIHTTAQGRRQQTVDGAVQTMERVNRTSYGALRNLTENGHKKARPPAVHVWASQTQTLPMEDDTPGREPPPSAALPPAPPVLGTPATPGEAEITRVTAAAASEPTAITVLDTAPETTAVTALTDPAANVAQPALRPADAKPLTERLHEPHEVVFGDGATYAGSGSKYHQTRVIWFRRLFGRR